LSRRVRSIRVEGRGVIRLTVFGGFKKETDHCTISEVFPKRGDDNGSIPEG